MARNIIPAVCAAAILLLVAATPARAQLDDNIEYRFAAGLARLGYHDLAAERFEIVRAGLRPETEAYFRVTLDLVNAWEGVVAAAVEPEDQLKYAELARKELEGLLATQLPPQYRNDLNVQYGRMLLRQGRLMTDTIIRQPAGIDPEALKENTRQMLDRAMKAFDEASAGYARIVREVEAMTRISDADRQRRSYSLQQQVVTANETGWTNFRLAEFYEQTGEEDNMKAALTKAVEAFEKVAAEHEDMIAGISAMLGLGRARQDLGDPKKAIEAYEKALAAEARGDAQRSLVEIQQFALFYRAEAMRQLEQYEQAVRSLNSLYELKRRHPRVPGVEMDAVIMELGRTYAAHAESLEKQAAGQQGAAAQRTLEQSRLKYKQAADSVSGIAQRSGRYSREALRRMGEWLAKSGEEVRDSSAGWFAEGERLFDAKNFDDAVQAYRRAIAAAGESPEETRLRQDSWLRMGQAYAMAENYYEAGLALGQAARLFPGEWFAENAAQHSSILLGAAYQRGRTPFESDIYIDAQQFLVENFPDNAAAQRAAVRLGDIQRNRRRFLEAARAYERVPGESPFFERAQFLSGESYWNAYENAAARREEGAEEFIEKAIARLRELARYAREESVANDDQRRTRSEYSGRAKIRLASIYINPALESPDSALEILRGFENEHADHQSLIPHALVLRIQAYAMAENPEGGESHLTALLDNFPEHEDNAMVARLLGETFIDQALAMRRADEKPEKSARFIASGGDYLLKSIDLKPDQSFEDFTLIASRLFQAEIYDGAARTFAIAAERFADRPEYEERVLAAREWQARCYMQTGEWNRAVELFDDIVEKQPRIMAVRRRLAISLENLETNEARGKALEQWRVVERTLRQGSDDWFEARYHISKNLAQLGNDDAAYQTVSTTAISYPMLGGERWRDRFIDVVRTEIRNEEYRRRFDELTREHGAEQ